VLHAVPLDVALPGLVEATEPATAWRVLGSAMVRAGAPTVGESLDVRILRYPMRGPCAIGFRTGDGFREGTTWFAKLFPDRRGSGLRDLVSALHADRDASGAWDFDLPVLVDYSSDLQLALFYPTRGRTLADLLRERTADHGEDCGDDDANLDLCARALASLHHARVTVDAVRTLDDDLAISRRHVEALRSDAPALASHLAAQLDTVTDAAALSDPPARPVLTHGRCGPASVLLGSGRPCLVDLEAVRLAEPARDLGSFLAALPAGAEPLATAFGARFFEAYVDASATSGALRQRTALHRRCQTVLGAMRAWRAFDVPLLQAFLARLEDDAMDEVPR
jgi:hypothetical protein